jgi:hypothetical protein
MRCATREGVNDSYLRRLIPLALLAPAIVEAICAGRQPIDLTTEKRRRNPLSAALSEASRSTCLALEYHRQRRAVAVKPTCLVTLPRPGDTPWGATEWLPKLAGQ